jgi:rhodanese-related sulfurtransferase
VDDLRSRLGELPRDREIAVYCQVGQRGYLATRILRQAGFVAANVGGGYKTYQLWRPNANGLPTGEAAALHAANVG